MHFTRCGQIGCLLLLDETCHIVIPRHLKRGSRDDSLTILPSQEGGVRNSGGFCRCIDFERRSREKSSIVVHAIVSEGAVQSRRDFKCSSDI